MNPVLESIKPVVEDSKYVSINKRKLKKVAKRFSKEGLKIPSWDAPVFMDGVNKYVIDFFMLGNSINFAFTDFDLKQKYASKYLGTEWRGAFGMWACLKNSISGDEGYPLFSAKFLKKISKIILEEIFEGNIKIPMLDERLKIFREVGRVLEEKYDGHFYNLVEQSDRRLFNNGDGIVERLIRDFPSFDDSVWYQGKKIRFDKRAQLACGMLYGRFLAQGIEFVDDVDSLTVFADYVLPVSLRGLGIMKLDRDLETRIENQELIEKNSREEIELRANTIHAGDLLMKEMRKLRKKVHALHLDYKLWSEGRKHKDKKHHLTKTIFY